MFLVLASTANPLGMRKFLAYPSDTSLTSPILPKFLTSSLSMTFIGEFSFRGSRPSHLVYFKRAGSFNRGALLSRYWKSKTALCYNYNSVFRQAGPGEVRPMAKSLGGRDMGF